MIQESLGAADRDASGREARKSREALKKLGDVRSVIRRQAHGRFNKLVSYRLFLRRIAQTYSSMTKIEILPSPPSFHEKSYCPGMESSV